MTGGLYVAAFAPSLHVNKLIIWQQRTLSEVFFPKLRRRNISADVSPSKHLDRDFRWSFRLHDRLTFDLWNNDSIHIQNTSD